MGRDSFLGTLLVAVVLCVVCALVVSTAAVGLHEKQQKNKLLYEKTNILKAAGLLRAKNSKPSEEGPNVPAIGKIKPKEIEALFEKRVRKVLVNLEDGKIVPKDQVDYDTYDPKDAAQDPELSSEIDSTPSPGVDRRANMQFVYEVLAEGEGEEVVQYVLPVYGKGLWSTLYGFLAIDADGKTVRGITFYEHGETPGLGGEVENAKWQESWDGKIAYDDDGNVQIKVVKGTSNPDNEQWTVDGLSGATITTVGVSNFVQYWLGPDGFGTFLKDHAS